jgi:hypothetical protein
LQNGFWRRLWLSCDSALRVSGHILEPSFDARQLLVQQRFIAKTMGEGVRAVQSRDEVRGEGMDVAVL